MLCNIKVLFKMDRFIYIYLFLCPHTLHRSIKEENQLDIEHVKDTHTHTYASCRQQRNQGHVLASTYSWLQVQNK